MDTHIGIQAFNNTKAYMPLRESHMTLLKVLGFYCCLPSAKIRHRKLERQLQCNPLDRHRLVNDICTKISKILFTYSRP